MPCFAWLTKASNDVEKRWDISPKAKKWQGSFDGILAISSFFLAIGGEDMLYSFCNTVE